MLASAYDAEIDGIYYYLYQWLEDGPQASVTYRDYDGNSYSGAVTIPESVTYEGMTYSVTSISSSAFSNCSALNSVTIPKTVVKVTADAFSGCPALTTIMVEQGNPQYDSRDACNAVIETGTNTLVAGCEHSFIPNSVTSIGAYAFVRCNTMTSITIPESVTSIGEYAFSECGLTSIVIPSGVKDIGNRAFYYCSSLTQASLAGQDVKVGDYAFSNCRSLTSVSILNSVSAFGEKAFESCSALTSVHITNLSAWCSTRFEAYSANPLNYAQHLFLNGEEITNLVIPNEVTSIGDYAFYHFSSLTSVSLGGSISYIGKEAFAECDNLAYNESGNCCYFGNGQGNSYAYLMKPKSRDIKYVTINSMCKVIAGSAFHDCYSLPSVNFPESVISIGPEAFYSCYALKSVTIPNKVTSISNSAFYGCTGLTSVTLPSGVTEICDEAFQYCENLTSINIPDGVTSIGEKAFRNCTNLPSITLPESVTSIGKQAFHQCRNLVSVNIPQGLTCINNSVFNDCNSLASITIPENVTSIGDDAFLRCNGLTFVTIPGKVTSIGDGAFYGCTNLKDVIISASVTSMGMDAFRNCNNLTSVTCLAETPPTIGYRAFTNGSNITLYVPVGSIDAYKTADVWTTFYFKAIKGANIEIGGIYYALDPETKTAEVAPPYSGAYSGEVVIPSSVRYNGERYRVTTIRQNAFSGTAGITSISIPSSITAIEPNTIPETATIFISVRKLLIELWNAGYHNIKEIGTGRSLDAPQLSFVPTASSLKVSMINVYSNFSNKLEVQGTSTTMGEGSKSLTGLEPATQYDFSLVTSLDDVSYTSAYTATTEELILTTKQPKVISDGNVIVAAQSNLDDEETNVGFEWRRTDWTDDFDSKTGGAYLYEGAMEGYIRSLNSKYLWKFRPYYTSNAGNTYYGDWKGLDPSDYSYFEPTVHTYANINVQGNTAEVRGYAMRGTDNIVTQGFIYWQNRSSYSLRKKAASIPSDAITVTTAKTNIMTATLEDLEFETEYCCVAFVTTSEDETFYGEVQTFSTSFDPDGIQEIKDDELRMKNEGEWYDLSGRKILNGQSSMVNGKLPRGINIIRYSDGTSKKVLIK